MKTFALAVFAAATACAGEVNFDSDQPCEPPAGWIAGQTGRGAAKWTIDRDDSAPSAPHALKQSGSADFPVCLRSESRVGDGFVEVKFKPLAGEHEQAGGVIFRAEDSDNFYACRASALSGTVVIEKVVDGQRTPLEFLGAPSVAALKAEVPRGQWSTLRVEFRGARFVVSLNGKRVGEAEDAMFASPGMVGVAASGDSTTLFDDFRWDGE